MLDSLIKEFMQQNIRVSRLVLKRSLKIPSGETVSSFMSHFRVILTYLQNKQCQDTVAQAAAEGEPESNHEVRVKCAAYEHIRDKNISGIYTIQPTACTLSRTWELVRLGAA